MRTAVTFICPHPHSVRVRTRRKWQVKGELRWNCNCEVEVWRWSWNGTARMRARLKQKMIVKFKHDDESNLTKLYAEITVVRLRFEGEAQMELWGWGKDGNRRWWQNWSMRMRAIEQSLYRTWSVRLYWLSAGNSEHDDQNEAKMVRRGLGWMWLMPDLKFTEKLLPVGMSRGQVASWSRMNLNVKVKQKYWTTPLSDLKLQDARSKLWCSD